MITALRIVLLIALILFLYDAIVEKDIARMMYMLCAVVVIFIMLVLSIHFFL